MTRKAAKMRTPREVENGAGDRPTPMDLAKIQVATGSGRDTIRAVINGHVTRPISIGEAILAEWRALVAAREAQP